MIPDYLEEFKVWELWELSDNVDKCELSTGLWQEEKKLKNESVLKVWELWKLSGDQNENESRFEVFEEVKNCEENLIIRYMCLSIVPNTFPYGLKELDFSFNKLMHIPEDLPETLEILNMNDNLVCTIPEKLPSNLRELLISNNKITDVPETLPDSITCLNVYNNAITILPNKLPRCLKRLAACRNQLACLPENLPESLEELEVAINKLTNLPNNLPQSLRSIHADLNEITNLPETLPELLNEIYIGYNKLNSLPERLPKSLEKLYISNNNLDKPKFDSQSIIELDLTNNGIEIILEAHFNLPKLQKLFVSENKLTSLPRNLPETLESLGAFNNYLSVIPNDLPKSLKDLDLDGNNIATLPENLPPQLEYLGLNCNKFTKISAEMPQSLNFLLLTSNLITEIALNIENIPNATIDLNENPLNETTLEYLRQLIRTTNRSNIWFDGSQEYYVNFVETRPLIEEIKNWLDADLINPYWNIISEEIITQSFSRLLYRIRQTPNFEVQQFKENISKWLYSLGEENDSMQRLREKVFLMAQEANESCEHRIGWSLNQMKILSITLDVESGKYDNKIEELIKLARGMYRLNILDQVSRQTVQNLQDKCDEIEIYLEYQIRLREIFDLPIDTPKMNKCYEFVLSDYDIKRAIKKINDQEQIDFINYLLIDWQPWKEILKRWNNDKFIKSENDIKNEEFFQQALDKRKMEYLNETNMSDISLNIEIQLGTQVQRKIEKEIWLKLTNVFLESKHLHLERLISFRKREAAVIKF